MKRNLPQIIQHEKGRIPPQAIELEESLIGAILIDRSAISDALHLISEDQLYKEEHKLIFAAVQELYLSGESVDILTVANKLRKKGELDLVGGEYNLIQLSQKVSSTAHLEYHARIITQKYIQREIIKNASELISLAFDETSDVFDLIDTAYNQLNTVAEVSIKPEEALIGTLIDGQITKARMIGKGEIKPGIPTPIRLKTEKMGGWRGSELIILAARPGMGKTALAISYGMHAARLGHPTAFFSLEMSKEQLTNRIISSEARIDSEKLTRLGLTEEEEARARKAVEPIRNTQFIIDDTPNISIERFQIEAKRMKKKYSVKMIIVDYLQLMTAGGSKGGNREQEISKISRGLKGVAKELNIPVIALSQLSRALESRSGHKRPMLSDLRESGAIEQDADIVEFIYRPEYYGMDDWDDYGGAPSFNEAEYIVAKNRNGGLTRNRMKFEKQFTQFSDIDDPQPFAPVQINGFVPGDEDFNDDIF